MMRELLFDVSRKEVSLIGTPLEWFYKEWVKETPMPKRFLYAEYFEECHYYTIHYMLGVM